MLVVSHLQYIREACTHGIVPFFFKKKSDLGDAVTSERIDLKRTVLIRFLN